MLASIVVYATLTKGQYIIIKKKRHHLFANCLLCSNNSDGRWFAVYNFGLKCMREKPHGQLVGRTTRPAQTNNTQHRIGHELFDNIIFFHSSMSGMCMCVCVCFLNALRIPKTIFVYIIKFSIQSSPI